MRMNFGTRPRLLALILTCTLAASTACGGENASGEPVKSPTGGPLKTETASTQIITNKTAGTAAELHVRAERALLKQDYPAAIEALEALRVGAPNAQVLYDLSAAYEGARQIEKSREAVRELTRVYPADTLVIDALVRQAHLSAYLEDWKEVGVIGERIMALPNASSVTKMNGLGARGLSKIEAGDDTAAMRDIQNGLDLVDEEHYGAAGRLPVAAAQLRFGLAEVRRARSEKISLANRTLEDFLPQFEARCAGLLDAQGAYADAIRSVNQEWAIMSGLRIGQMYQTLHTELMKVPPTKAANDDKKRDLFYAMMHVRYRVLLEKGLDMMDRTIALGDKLQDASNWVTRAKATKTDIEKAIEEEKAALKKLPYTEEEVQKALDILKKKVIADQEKAAEKAAKKEAGGK